MSDNDTHQPDGVLHAEKSISDYLAEQVDAVSETRLRSEAGMLGSFRARGELDGAVLTQTLIEAMMADQHRRARAAAVAGTVADDHEAGGGRDVGRQGR